MITSSHKKGFSILDLLIAAAVGALLLATLLTTYILLERNFDIGFTRTSVSSLTRGNISRLVSDLEQAVNAGIYDNFYSTELAVAGNRIDITLYSFPDCTDSDDTYIKKYYSANGNELWCAKNGNTNRVAAGLALSDYLFSIADPTPKVDDINSVAICIERQSGYREGGQFNVKLQTKVRLRNRQ